MREILFRGKSKSINKGEWIYGSFVEDTDLNACCIRDKSLVYELVDRETVGQFTGLTDKNGEKIFEGDIIRLTPPKESGEIYIPTSRNPQEDRILKVIFFDGMFAVDMSKWFKYGHGKVALQTYETNRIEVIGNIHDNSGLLKEYKK